MDWETVHLGLSDCKVFGPQIILFECCCNHCMGEKKISGCTILTEISSLWYSSEIYYIFYRIHWIRYESLYFSIEKSMKRLIDYSNESNELKVRIKYRIYRTTDSTFYKFSPMYCNLG